MIAKEKVKREIVHVKGCRRYQYIDPGGRSLDACFRWKELAGSVETEPLYGSIAHSSPSHNQNWLPYSANSSPKSNRASLSFGLVWNIVFHNIIACGHVIVVPCKIRTIYWGVETILIIYLVTLKERSLDLIFRRRKGLKMIVLSRSRGVREGHSVPYHFLRSCWDFPRSNATSLQRFVETPAIL